MVGIRVKIRCFVGVDIPETEKAGCWKISERRKGLEAALALFKDFI